MISVLLHLHVNEKALNKSFFSEENVFFSLVLLFSVSGGRKYSSFYNRDFNYKKIMIIFLLKKLNYIWMMSPTMLGAHAIPGLGGPLNSYIIFR